MIGMLAAMLILSFGVSCSGSKEPKSRKSQIAGFEKVLGFPPAASIEDIRYYDLYNRGVFGRVYGQWLRFSYDEDAFAKILASPGFTPTLSSSMPNEQVAPDWWASIGESTMAYSRSDEDTKFEDDFRFTELLWYEESSGFVYFYRDSSE